MFYEVIRIKLDNKCKCLAQCLTLKQVNNKCWLLEEAVSLATVFPLGQWSHGLELKKLLPSELCET